VNEERALHITRNPFGFNEQEVREARLKVCDRLVAWKEAYENMRDYAISQGLDVTTYGPRK